MGKVRVYILRSFLKNFFIFLIIFVSFFSYWSHNFVYADITSTLRPIADGGEDSSFWQNSIGSTCDAVDCYVEVYESSGSSCTDSDGDTTYISSSGGGEAQTFDIDESSIPGNSTITQIDITVCHIGEGLGGGGTFRTRTCHNGVCISSGLTMGVGVNYAETTQQISVDYTKNSSSDIEIGIIDINLFRNVRISQVSANITYTLPAEDTILPSAVTNLALSNPSDTAITVSWTAPGDDESTGTATSYDLRYSTSEITEANWSSATQVSSEPTPSVAGSSESMTVSGLTESTIYYFALKTSDEVPNESGISNVPNLATTAVPDTTVPSAVTNLALSNPSDTAITVLWTAPGDDADVGTATSYDLRYSTSEITDGNWSSATQVSSEPTPSATGSSESMTVSGLTESTIYYFALKTSDEVPNESGLSNVPNLATTMDTTGEEEEEEEPPVSGVGPRKVYFLGQAYPGGKVELFRKREETGTFVAEPAGEYTISKDGVFEIMQKGLIGVKFFFALRAEDKDKRKSGILSFDVNMRREHELIVKDIFFPPTVGFESVAITKDQEVKIMGYAASKSRIEIKIDDVVKGESQSDQTGFWAFATNVFDLDFGEHYVRVRQINQSGVESGFSFPRTFKISPLDMPKADFNNDSKVNITDWSIFLYNWGSEDEVLKPKIDMNNDGNINIADFSIFLKAMKI